MVVSLANRSLCSESPSQLNSPIAIESQTPGSITAVPQDNDRSAEPTMSLHSAAIVTLPAMDSSNSKLTAPAVSCASNSTPCSSEPTTTEETQQPTIKAPPTGPRVKRELFPQHMANGSPVPRQESIQERNARGQRGRNTEHQAPRSMLDPLPSSLPPRPREHSRRGRTENVWGRATSPAAEWREKAMPRGMKRELEGFVTAQQRKRARYSRSRSRTTISRNQNYKREPHHHEKSTRKPSRSSYRRKYHTSSLDKKISYSNVHNPYYRYRGIRFYGDSYRPDHESSDLTTEHFKFMRRARKDEVVKWQREASDAREKVLQRLARGKGGDGSGDGYGVGVGVVVKEREEGLEIGYPEIDQSLCYNCLAKGHSFLDCTKRCGRCGKDGHRTIDCGSGISG